jgi:hypothetical protein
MILDGLKKRLHDENTKKGGKWINEISSVVWGLRTQSSKATGQSPFFLVYGSEAILPADVMWQSPRLEMYQEGEVDDAIHLELDSADEVRWNVLLQLACYLQGVRCYHDQNVQARSFNVGDLVLRHIQDETGCTSLIRDGRDPSSCSRLQDQGHMAYSTLMARRSQTPGISSIYASFTLS